MKIRVEDCKFYVNGVEVSLAGFIEVRTHRQPSATLPIEFRDVDHLIELIGGETGE